jgi:lipopolysaccharide/colanic/teichoic acid biosynthesis glycosyltransferase
MHREHPILVGLALYVLDCACIAVAYLAAVVLGAPDTAPTSQFFFQNLPYGVVFAAVWCLVASDQRIFARTRRSDMLIPQLVAVTNAVFVALVITVFLLSLLLTSGVNSVFMWSFAGAVYVTLLLCRLLVRLSIWDLRRRGYSYRRVVLVGSNESTLHLAQVLLSNMHYGYHLLGFLEDDPARAKGMDRLNVPYLGTIEQLEALLSQQVVDGVYITLPLRSHYETVRRVTNLCEGVGVPARLVADLFPQRISSQEIVRLENIPLITLSGEPMVQPQRLARRLGELLISTVLLIILSPLLAACAILVKLNSPGPVVVTRECVGLGQKPFRMLYFRCNRHSDPGLEPPGSDATLTSIGSIFRRYSLDELPQLLNVCLGHMSTIGPRPISLADFEVETQRWRRVSTSK